MNWFFLLFAFCIAVITGSIAATTFARLRPEWSERRRLLASALVLPALTLLGAALGSLALLLSGPGEGESMQEGVLGVMAGIGAIFALLAFVGGLIGAGLRQRGMRR